jgi:DNA-directed RNA polymerase subunit M/transcription elongation factor TFIIS
VCCLKGEDFLLVNQQMNYAREMTECGKNGYKCKNNIRIKYKKLYDKNRQEKLAEIKRELSKPQEESN